MALWPQYLKQRTEDIGLVLFYGCLQRCDDRFISLLVRFMTIDRPTDSNNSTCQALTGAMRFH